MTEAGEYFSNLIKTIAQDGKLNEQKTVEQMLLKIKELKWEEEISEKWIRKIASAEFEKTTKERIKVNTLAEQYNGLEKNIYTLPPSLAESDLKKYNKKNIFIEVSDIRIVLDKKTINWLELVVGLIIIAAILSLLTYQTIRYQQLVNYHVKYVDNGNQQPNDYKTKRLYNESLANIYREGGLAKLETRTFNIALGYPSLFFILCLLVLGFYLIYVATKQMKDVLIFDRIAGTVHYQYKYGMKNITATFDDILLQSLMKSMHFGGSSYLNMRFPEKNISVPLASNHSQEFCSFYVWYMDKNRPLPQGSAFDAYREKDYLHRKETGFLHPLYPSSIEIPEWEGAEKQA